MQNGKGLHQEGFHTATPPDWDRLVSGDMTHKLRTLRAWLGPRRVPDLEMEHGYWEILATHASGPELAEAVLERLDLEGDRLLDLESSELLRLRDLLESMARERLDQLDLPPGDRDRIRRHSFLLAEAVFESEKSLPQAAALYALAHEATAGKDTFSIYEAILLRFKLGNVMLLLDEQPERRRHCINLVRKAAVLTDAMKASERVPHDALRALALEIRMWLGHREEEAGEKEAAADSFCAAMRCAATVDDRVECAARAASALSICGRSKEAREVLLSVSDEVEVVENAMVRDFWEAVLWSLNDG